MEGLGKLYGYDANGNIQKLMRNSNLTANPLMDNLTYVYKPGTNQLDHVRDTTGAGVTAHSNNYASDVDIKDQSAGNYNYDAIGNMVYDRFSSIDSIKWNVYGKIQTLYKGVGVGSSVRRMHFYYDPSREKVGKITLYTANSTNAADTYTWYVRDAQGNVMAVYQIYGSNITTSPLNLLEQFIYGSSRLGSISRNLNMDASRPDIAEANYTHLGKGNLITFTRGNKLFEIANHLGTVNMTVTDQHLPVLGSGSQVLFTPKMASAEDFTPFGMRLQGRISDGGGGAYRFKFNGKERIYEINGRYNQYDYGMRIYDDRLGRFLSTDPITNKYPELTPYQYASNSPISGIDRDGLEWFYYNYLFGWKESQYPKTILYSESYMNKLGYYSSQQVHKFQQDDNRRQEIADAVQHSIDLVQSAKDWQGMKNNPLRQFYELSPVKAIYDASQYLSEGNYTMATIAGVAGAVDLGPLFRTFGKGYGAVAKQLASQFTTEGAWKLGNFARGAILEAKAAAGYVAKGYEWLAESASPFFKTIDFYNAAEKTAVSLKTVNAEGNFGFVNIFENIDNLANMRRTGSTAQFGVERVVQNVELHIAVPKGYDKSVFKDVEKAAKKAKVKLEYVTIPE